MTDSWDAHTTTAGSNAAAPRVTIAKRAPRNSKQGGVSLAKRPSGSNRSKAAPKRVLARRPQNASPQDIASSLAVYTGDIDEALLDAIQGKHKMALLKFEDQLVKFVTARSARPSLTFPPLPSYQRLLLHRLAERFNLTHDAIIDEAAATAAGLSATSPVELLEPHRTVLVVQKTELTKKPNILLLQIAQAHQEERAMQGKPKILLKKRSTNANAKNRKPKPKLRGSNDKAALDAAAKQKQAEYEAIRARILGVSSPAPAPQQEQVPRDPNKPLTSLDKLTAADFKSGRRTGAVSEVAKSAGEGEAAVSRVARGPDTGASAGRGFASAGGRGRGRGRGRSGGRGRGAPQNRDDSIDSTSGGDQSSQPNGYQPTSTASEATKNGQTNPPATGQRQQGRSEGDEAPVLVNKATYRGIHPDSPDASRHRWGYGRQYGRGGYSGHYGGQFYGSNGYAGSHMIRQPVSSSRGSSLLYDPDAPKQKQHPKEEQIQYSKDNPYAHQFSGHQSAQFGYHAPHPYQGGGHFYPQQAPYPNHGYGNQYASHSGNGYHSPYAQASYHGSAHSPPVEEKSLLQPHTSSGPPAAMEVNTASTR